VSPIKLTLKEVRQHLNLPRLAEVEIASRLKNLGFAVQSIEEGAALSIVPPSWRVWDIKNTADLVEEVVRTLSLSRVKQELPPLEYETPERTSIEQLRERIEPVLIGQGFIEVMTRSYYSAEVAETLIRIGKRTSPRHITIKNALERGYSHLKISNVVHLAELLEENIRHGVRGARVFECARVFSPDFAAEDAYPFEKEVLSLACAGRWADREWRKPESTEQKLQLFRGVLDTLIESAGYEPSVGESDDPFLHPGMQGSLKAGRSICGRFGMVHPELTAALDVKTPVLFAELDVAILMRIQSARERVFPSDFPSVKRDITLQVPLRERLGKVERLIGEAKLAELAAVEIIDDFKKPEEDFRRATFRLVFQSRERTLSHPEVDAEMERLLSALKESAGLVLAA
jgi:phenylalanyl-tRNA synthetase beta chain